MFVFWCCKIAEDGKGIEEVLKLVEERTAGKLRKERGRKGIEE